jgi:toxin ParE1/3/4
MTRNRWTSGAYEYLAAIGDYIARRDPGNAARFVAELMDRVLVLQAQSLSGRVLPEMGDPAIRELIHKNYRIVYRVVGEEAHILTIFEDHMLLRSFAPLPSSLGARVEIIKIRTTRNEYHEGRETSVEYSLSRCGGSVAHRRAL